MWGIPTEAFVQGIGFLLLLLWAFRDARAKYDATKQTLQPNPMVAAVSMSWDRDMHERLLQVLERMALAAEQQADMQKAMSGSWMSMADRQREAMDQKIDRLLRALDDAEDKSLSATVAAHFRSGG